MGIKIHHRFSNLDCAFMLEHLYLIVLLTFVGIYLLPKFYLKKSLGKMFWKRKQKKRKKRRGMPLENQAGAQPSLRPAFPPHPTPPPSPGPLSAAHQARPARAFLLSLVFLSVADGRGPHVSDRLLLPSRVRTGHDTAGRIQSRESRGFLPNHLPGAL